MILACDHICKQKNLSAFFKSGYCSPPNLKEMHKFLALPIDEKTSRDARMVAMLRQELGEQEEEEMKNLRQVKSRTVLHQQTAIRSERKRAMMKQSKPSTVSHWSPR